LKYLLGRYRPIMLFEHSLYGLNFFSSEWALNWGVTSVKNISCI
jgi:hypothetical protein